VFCTVIVGLMMFMASPFGGFGCESFDSIRHGLASPFSSSLAKPALPGAVQTPGVFYSPDDVAAMTATAQPRQQQQRGNDGSSGTRNG
jgi:hypothetical protein